MLKSILRPLAAVATLAACSWTMPAHALVGGTDTSSFTAVGELGGATGVLIADNWVLTVAHVANGLTSGSSSFTSLSGSATVDAIYTFGSAAYPDNDIALVHLSTAISGAITPILNDTALTTRTVSQLGSVTVATAQNETPNGVGTVSAQSVLTTYTNSAGVTSTTNWIITGGSVYVEGGDSGSGLFKGVVGDSADATLLGLASASITDINGNHQSAFVQVATYKTWINSIMTASGQSARWLSTSAVPEPGSLALMGLGLIGVAWSRRRVTHTAA